MNLSFITEIDTLNSNLRPITSSQINQLCNAVTMENLNGSNKRQKSEPIHLRSYSALAPFVSNIFHP